MWFTDQNSKPLEIEDKPRHRILVKGNRFLSFV